jgi:hypothetical protein
LQISIVNVKFFVAGNPSRTQWTTLGPPSGFRFHCAFSLTIREQSKPILAFIIEGSSDITAAVRRRESCDSGIVWKEKGFSGRKLERGFNSYVYYEAWMKE